MLCLKGGALLTYPLRSIYFVGWCMARKQNKERKKEAEKSIPARDICDRLDNVTPGNVPWLLTEPSPLSEEWAIRLSQFACYLKQNKKDNTFQTAGEGRERGKLYYRTRPARDGIQSTEVS